MDNNLAFSLKKIGLADKEIAVYLTLIENGPLSVRELAKISGINRGTSYDVLKSLIEKGLVSYYDKTTRRQFNAESPLRLKEFYHAQLADLEKMNTQLDVIISQLQSRQQLPHKPVTRFFEGYKGIKSILLDVLETMKNAQAKNYYIYSSSNIRNHLYKSFKNFTSERIRNGLFVKAIAIGKGGGAQQLAQRKWLDKNKQGTPTYKIIYHHKIALISLMNQKLVGTIIEDPNLYETEKYIFEFLWRKL